jgi:hypothetical protein
MSCDQIPLQSSSEIKEIMEQDLQQQVRTTAAEKEKMGSQINVGKWLDQKLWVECGFFFCDFWNDKIAVTDGRVIVGRFVCTDQHPNIILVDSKQFWLVDYQKMGKDGNIGERDLPIRNVGMV